MARAAEEAGAEAGEAAGQRLLLAGEAVVAGLTAADLAASASPMQAVRPRRAPCEALGGWVGARQAHVARALAQFGRGPTCQ